MFLKKNLSVLLAVVMVLVMVPIGVFEFSAAALTINDDDGYDFSDTAPDDELYYDLQIDDDDFITDWPDELDNDITFEPEFDFSESGIATAGLQNIRDYENRIDVTLDKTIGGDDLKSIFTKQDLCISGDPNKVFFTMQGSCSDGEMVYFAFTANVKINENEAATAENIKQLDLRIVCVPIDANGNLSLASKSISVFDKDLLYKANDMTYNSITDQVVVAACVTGDHDALYTIDATNLQHNGVSNTVAAKKHNVSCKITSIDFCERESCYFVGITKYVHLFAKLDYDFNYIGLLGDKNVDDSLDISSDPWKRQTVYVDNNYIYNLLYLYDSENPTKENITENMIEIYDLKGNYKKTIYFTVTNGTDRRYEMENINIINGKVLIGFNCVKSVLTRNFCYYDFTENCFTVKYCPDDNVAQHLADNSLPTSSIVHGFGTRLFANNFVKSGYKFVGWYAYRPEVQKWYYVNEATETYGWYSEGNQPAGYKKYYYSDKQNVSKTSPAGTNVYMCAQWTADNNFTVKFSSNGGTGSMNPQTIKHGTATSLSTNTFTKQNRTFQGWNAYWVEKNQWLFEKTSTGDLAWYVEGAQPLGYKKYTYSNGENVSKTVHKGSTVIMYALWDEYYIYYHSNGTQFDQDKLLKRITGRYSQGSSNPISAFASSNFSGYHLYRREVNKWLYENTSTNELGWYKKGSQPTGYTLHFKTFSNGVAYLGATAPSGEHLVLYAQWN